MKLLEAFSGMIIAVSAVLMFWMGFWAVLIYMESRKLSRKIKVIHTSSYKDFSYGKQSFQGRPFPRLAILKKLFQIAR